MKKAVIGLVLVVALAVGGLALYVDEVLGTAIEKAGSYAMGVDTQVGFVRLRVLRGDFRMNRFRIENPDAFDQPHFLTMHDATIAVDTGTLREPVVVVPELRLHDVAVSLEREGGQTNYGVVLANLKRFEKQNPEGTTPPAEEAGSDRRFIVNRITITDVDAYVEWNELAADETGLQLTIPQIVLENVGAENAKGVAMSELTDVILKAILGSIARYGGDLPGAMLSALKGGLGGLERVPGVVVSGLGGSAVEKVGEMVGGDVGDAIRGVGGSAAEGVGDAVDESAKGALQGLFGTKKEGN